MMNRELSENYLETVAETRFSDFTHNGTLHFSKSLLYFEKARFYVAQVSGIRDILGKMIPDAEIAFIITHTRLTMRKPVHLHPGEYELPLHVRTWLEPSLCQLRFCQQLISPEDESIFTEALIDVVILINGEVMHRFPKDIQDCLDGYIRQLSNGKYHEKQSSSPN